MYTYIKLRGGRTWIITFFFAEFWFSIDIINITNTQNYLTRQDIPMFVPSTATMLNLKMNI